MATDLSADSMDSQRQLDAARAAEKAKEAEQKAPDPSTDRALLGVETAQMARVEAAKSMAQEGADEDEDRNTDGDHEHDTDTKDDFAKDVDALLAEFHLSDTGDAKKNFFLVAEKLSHEVQDKYKIPWQVCLVQACLESGYGEGMNNTGRKGYVIFGIKADKAYAGRKVDSATKDGADLHDNVAAFRAYSSIRDAFTGYGEFLTHKDRYKAAFEHTDDPGRFLLELQKAHYFEDPKYLEKAKTVGNAYGFHFYESSTLPPPPDSEEEEKHWYTGIVDFFSDSWSKIKDAVKSFFWAMGWKWSEDEGTGQDAAPSASLPPALAPELGPEWREKLEDPDAPFFSFPKGTNAQVSSTFGLRENPFKKGEIDDHSHAGVDIAAAEGTPVYATHSGKVVEPHSASVATVRTADGVEHPMRHLSENYVKVGQNVVAGQLIGKVGNVGRSTGAHLHVEARLDGRAIDPIPTLGAKYAEQARAVAASQKERVAEIQAGDSRVA